VNKAKDVAGISAEDLLQLFTRTGPRGILINDPATDESAPDLIIQILAVGHHQKSEIARNAASDLLGKKRH
jgi:hypothetical protein